MATSGSSNVDLDLDSNGSSGADAAPARNLGGRGGLPSAAEVLFAASAAESDYFGLSGVGGGLDEEERDSAAVVHEFAALVDELPL